MSRRPVLRVTAAACVLAATAASSSPASAQVKPLPTDTPSAAPHGEADALAQRYASLSGALLGYYATNSGQSLQNFVSQNSPAVQSLFGPSAAKLSATSVAGLNAQLGANGMLVDRSAFLHLSDLAGHLERQAGTPDARVINAGAAYSQQVAALRVPQLRQPIAGDPGSALATSMPKEGLAFGLFLNKSLTAMVTDFPDVFAEVSRRGVSTPQAQAAWSASMDRAWAATAPDFNSGMIDSCSAAGLMTMANGDPSATARSGVGKGGCGGCVLLGLHQHHQMTRLWDPRATSPVPTPGDNSLNSQQMAGLPDWLRGAIAQQNPGKALSPSSLGLGAGSDAGNATCSTASTAAKDLLGDQLLPSVLDGLARR